MRKVIDDVITCQQNGLHNSVETVSSVLKEYSQGQSDIAELRKSLKETKSVLTAKKSGQIAMKDLWSKKKELEETLRILHDLEWLKVYIHLVIVCLFYSDFTFLRILL